MSYSASAIVEENPVERPPASGGSAILRPGRNCWRVERAERAAVLVDAQAYFACLAKALEAARRSISIIAWDFDAVIRLRPQDGEAAEQLGPFLRRLVEERPELEIRILVWNLSVLHAPSAAVPHLLGERWEDHPRIHVRLDSNHPALGAQHQKIVAIDERIAFVGGIDLTVDRWDVNDHPAEHDLRVKPDGRPYGPVHDMQMLVDGEAARAVAELAAEEWRRAGGGGVARVTSDSDPWPAGLQPDFTDVPVAIARTRPRWRRMREVREAANLTCDAILAAQRSIYIEAQYFTDFRLGEIIARRLQESDGPEVVIVVTRTMHGFIEGLFMNGNRRRLVRMLQRADRFGRLRIWHPVVPGANGECEVLIHAKLVIADDRFLRVGSSNLNNRSTGFDLECDLAIEATDAPARAAIVRVRNRLLGEHLHCPPEEVAAAVAETGSLIGAIEARNTNGRRLSAFTPTGEGPTGPVLGTRLVDPRRPSPLRLPFMGLRRSRRRHA